MRSWILVLVLAACNGGAPAAPDAPFSKCGHPGDTGNEQGVGKYCTSLSDCSQTVNAGLCSNVGDETTFFCTHTCNATDPPDICGTGATCECGNGGCGCTP